MHGAHAPLASLTRRSTFAVVVIVAVLAFPTVQANGRSDQSRTRNYE